VPLHSGTTILHSEHSENAKFAGSYFPGSVSSYFQLFV
jgi:hypothetical protein